MSDDAATTSPAPPAAAESGDSREEALSAVASTDAAPAAVKSVPAPPPKANPTSTFFTPVKPSSNGHLSSTTSPPRPPLVPSAFTPKPLPLQKTPSSSSSSSSTTSSTSARPPQVKAKPSAISTGLDADPLLHPLQSRGDGGLDDDASGGGSAGVTASPAFRGSLTASLSSSDLSLSTSSPATSPIHSSNHSTPSQPPSSLGLSITSSSPALPSAASFSIVSPTSSSSSTPPTITLSSSAPPTPSPLTSSTSSSGLSSWFSSLSSSLSASRDVALISYPPDFIPNYFTELSAFLHTQTSHPSPATATTPTPSVLADLADKLPPAYTPPPSSAIAAALSELDSRRKQAHTYAASPVKKRVTRLQRMVELNAQHMLELKHLIVRARKKCDAGYEGLQLVVERLRSWYLMNEFNLLQEGMHLQDELFDNYEDMLKASVLALRDKNAAIQHVIEQLQTAPAASLPVLSEFFFLSSKHVCMLNPVLPDMVMRQAAMVSRLSQVKVEYVAVSKATEEEEKLGRVERIARVIADFYHSYKGDLTADYSPARALEYEFARLCCDERTKEGQTLKKWMASIHSQATAQAEGGAAVKQDGKGGAGGGERVTHHSVLVWMRKFESNFAKEYGVDAAHRLYLRLLIQRMLFPRIWDVCCLIEDAAGDSKEKDEVYQQQSEWLRLVKLEQLGVTPPFLMPDTVKQAVMQKISAGSSRWSKAKEGDVAHDEEKEGVGGGRLPRQLPTALRDLLHLNAAEKKEGSSGAPDTIAGGTAVVEDNDAFDRLFKRGGGGGGDKGAGPVSGNLFDKFDAGGVGGNGSSVSSSSPSVSPSPSFSSPLSTATSATTSASSSFSLTMPAPITTALTPPTSSTTVLHSSTTNSSSSSSSSHSTSSASSTSSSASTSASSSSSTALPLSDRVSNLRSRSSPLPARLRPYLSSIECLEDISHLTTPLDMLQCLLAVARNIYKTATEYSQLNAEAAGEKGGGKKAELGADSFFPIWVYVLIQSEVKDLHRRMRMMKEYGVVKTAELAEHDYYLTCMEGALVFVREADPDKY